MRRRRGYSPLPDDADENVRPDEEALETDALHTPPETDTPVEEGKENEGWSALYRGLSVNLVRTVPNSAVTMLTYAPFPSVLRAGELTATRRYEMLMRYLSARTAHPP